MGIIEMVVVLIIVGVLLYIVKLIPMDGTIKQIITIVVILFVCLWVLNALFGFFGPIHDIRIGR